MDTSTIRRVGYWWSEKKSKKLNANELADVCRSFGLELVKVDLERPLEEQGPFAAIVHKMSDVLVKAKCGDSQSQAICESFQQYADSHPNMAVIDSLSNIDKLLDRYGQYKMVEECEICKEGDIFIPAFVELTTMNWSENVAKLRAANLDFPIVCKPAMAHGPIRSHQMCIIFNEKGLNDITVPCIVQKLINHNAVLYKLFVIGNKYFITERPSLKNFSAGDQETIYFESNDVSKPNSASELTELDDDESYVPAIWPEKEKMDKIVKVLHEQCGLNLLGIDVIVDNITGHYGIIDINVFPGYYEACNFYSMLTSLILHKIHLKESNSEEELPYKPILLEHLSTPAIRMKEASQEPENVVQFAKTTSNPSDNLPCLGFQCFCCPISSSFSSEGQKCPGPPLQEQRIAEPSDNLLVIQKQTGVAEDSGVETSDSCDEKKKKYCHRTVKHQHSKVSDAV